MGAEGHQPEGAGEEVVGVGAGDNLEVGVGHHALVEEEEEEVEVEDLQEEQQSHPLVTTLKPASLGAHQLQAESCERASPL